MQIVREQFQPIGPDWLQLTNLNRESDRWLIWSPIKFGWFPAAPWRRRFFASRVWRVVKWSHRVRRRRRKKRRYDPAIFKRSLKANVPMKAWRYYFWFQNDSKEVMTLLFPKREEKAILRRMHLDLWFIFDKLRRRRRRWINVRRARIRFAADCQHWDWERAKTITI